MELEAEAKKLVAYVLSLEDNFEIIRAEPVEHIGAIIADAVLQVGHRWKTHVGPRIERIKNKYPGAATISGLLHLLETRGARELLNWNGKDEQERFRQTAEFFANEQIETIHDLHKWLESEDNRDRLVTKSPRDDKAGIAKIADKTADYYRVLVGIPDAVAIDTLIREFLTKGHIDIGKYDYRELRTTVQLAARQMLMRPIDLDQSIWNFQSESKLGEARGVEMAKDNIVATDNTESSGERSSDRYTLIGTIYPQRRKDEKSSWEIDRFTQDEIEQLPHDKYPFVPRTGVGVTLLIDGIEYEASFHHPEGKKCTTSWIGSAFRRTGNKQPMWEILDKHGLAVNGMKVRLEFEGYRVYVSKY